MTWEWALEVERGFREHGVGLRAWGWPWGGMGDGWW